MLTRTRLNSRAKNKQDYQELKLQEFERSSVGFRQDQHRGKLPSSG